MVTIFDTIARTFYNNYMSFGLVLSFYCIGAPAGSSNLQLNPKFGRTFIIWKVLALQLNSEFGSFEFGTSTMERSCSPTYFEFGQTFEFGTLHYGKILLSNLFLKASLGGASLLSCISAMD